MTSRRRIHLGHVVLAVVAAGAASHAASIQQGTTSPPTALSTGGVMSAPVATNAVPSVSGTESYAVQVRSSLLGDTGGESLTEPVLVVPGKPMEPQAINQTVEDLSIMGRIIEKNALGQDRGRGDYVATLQYVLATREAGDGAVSRVLFPSPGRPKPMYLGGYGVVFFLQVSYPLLPPPQMPQEKPTAQQEDPVWAQAKRDVLEPQTDVILPHEAGEPAEPYSRETVDMLKGQLIATMKHATNIRVLEPGEWITIVVQGTAAPQTTQNADAAATSTAAGRTVLTLRATKTDVDQYAKGQLSQQQFEQRLQTVTY